MTVYSYKIWKKCNSLSPQEVYNIQSKKFAIKLLKETPLEQMINKNQYGEFVNFLCSDKFSYMNEQNIIVDGARNA